MAAFTFMDNPPKTLQYDFDSLSCLNYCHVSVCKYVCVCLCVWSVCVFVWMWRETGPQPSRAGMCMMFNRWAHPVSALYQIILIPLFSLFRLLLLISLLFLTLSRPPCSLSQKPRMLTGDILHLWGQGCRGKHFPPSNSPLTSDQLKKT